MTPGLPWAVLSPNLALKAAASRLLGGATRFELEVNPVVDWLSAPSIIDASCIVLPLPVRVGHGAAGRGLRKEKQCHGIEGNLLRGEAIVDGKILPLRPRDIFVVLYWNKLVLFSYSDRAAQEKLNLYREHCA